MLIQNMMDSRKRIVCIVGPTASGKTALSIRLAKELNAEIISADSVQVYRGLDIGSAKPTKEEQQGIAHHLIDCIDVDCAAFSVSAYRKLAVQAIENIVARGKMPIVVGGSGLYVNSLTYPLNFAIPSDPVIRTQLEHAYPIEQTQKAWEKLQDSDPVTANRLHPNDRKRIIRALEVYQCSGRPFSSFGNDFANVGGAEAPFDATLIGLTMPREALYERINARVEQMLKDGLLEEVKQLAAKGYSRRLPAMLSIGYRQLLSYLDQQCTYEDAVESIKRESRRFAKRQIAWFKRDDRIQWFDTSEESTDTIINNVLTLIHDAGHEEE